MLLKVYEKGVELQVLITLLRFPYIIFKNMIYFLLHLTPRQALCEIYHIKASILHCE